MKGEYEVKIAITSRGEDKDASVDTRFGRAEYFLIYDQETDTWECLPNRQSLTAAHGAGIQAAQTVLKAGARALITGHIGPKAFKVLDAGGMAIYSAGEVDEKMTAEEILGLFVLGKLAKMTVPNPIDTKKS